MTFSARLGQQCQWSVARTEFPMRCATNVWSRTQSLTTKLGSVVYGFNRFAVEQSQLAESVQRFVNKQTPRVVVEFPKKLCWREMIGLRSPIKFQRPDNLQNLRTMTFSEEFFCEIKKSFDLFQNWYLLVVLHHNRYLLRDVKVKGEDNIGIN